MNNTAKTNDSEFRIIDILNESNNVTQRSIASKAGISLGLTNIIIKRLIKKGFVKIKNMDKKRILYHLTPKAIIEKSYRTYNYFERTMKDIVQIREKIQREILYKNKLKSRKVVILGNNEISEIAKWATQELKLRPVVIASPEKKNKIDLEKSLVINCNKNHIKKRNYINVFKIL